MGILASGLMRHTHNILNFGDTLIANELQMPVLIKVQEIEDQAPPNH